MTEFSDTRIIESWHTNASPWTKAVQDEAIESRRLVTDRAIIQTVCDMQPQTVFDIGCGEGWLARALSDTGMQVFGVDAVPELVAQADKRGGGRFCVCSYEMIGQAELHAGPFDLAVCNFSLIGKEAVESLLTTLPSYLNEHGRVCIQTLHPVVVTGERPYQDGWRSGSWDGFGPEFTDPAPWYFRTVESWLRLLRRSGFDILECREPLHPTTGKPASVIFVGEKK